jgi:hypothetical protein
MISSEIRNLILFDKKNLFAELDLLKKELGLNEKIDSLAKFIDEVDSIHLTNIDSSSNDIESQLIAKHDKRLEIRCNIRGKKQFLKSFGNIGKIEQTKLQTIFKFVSLVKLIKSIDEASFYASQYYRMNKL